MTTTVSRPAGHQTAPIVGPPDASNSRSTTPHSKPIPGSSGGSTYYPAASADAAPGDEPPQGTTQDRAAEVSTTPTSGSLLDPALCLAADVLDDIERVRIANDNRLRQLVRTEVDSDGEERGFGLDPDHPDVMRLGVMIEMLKRIEHDATLELQRKLRKHPLGEWVKQTRGVGEKQGARLLAAIGDPYINSAKGLPRTVSALWAYCGLHVLPVDQPTSDAQKGAIDRSQLPGGLTGTEAQTSRAAGDQHRDTDHLTTAAHPWGVGVAAKRRKGERANWSTKAKMRAYLIAESCIKQLSPQCRDGHELREAQGLTAVPACACSPYRVVYDGRRAHTAITRPEWTDGHSHNDALRVASKAILRDLWRAAREWHLSAAPDFPGARIHPPSPSGG